MSASPPGPAETSGPRSDERLRPVLGLVTASAIVIGGVIGSGIFLGPSRIAYAFESLGQSADAARAYVPLILVLWIVCGLVNLCGALTLAELSAMMPHAGGTYVFLREAYGRPWAFLWGWAEFWVIRSGSIASLATGMSMVLNDFLRQLNPERQTDVGLGLQIGLPLVVIVVLTGINIIGTRWGGGVQVATSIVKAGIVAMLAALPFLVERVDTIDFGRIAATSLSVGLFAAIASSVSAIMWAYDGWGNVTVVAEEIKNPQVNVPRALGLGLVVLIALYVGANIAYHTALPFADVAANARHQATKSDSAADAPSDAGAATKTSPEAGSEAPDTPAVILMKKAFGKFGGQFMAALLIVSMFGALNANLLIGPRVLFAVARDNRFLAPFRRIDPSRGTPALAIAGLAVWSCLLILAGGLVRSEGKRLFDVLTDYCIFGGSLFYFAAVIAVFVFRRTRPNAERPYRTWGYPVVPLVFLLFYVFFLGGMLWTSPVTSLIGLGLISTGLVVYFAARGRGAAA